MQIREYSYRCKDYSVLTPPFKKWVVTPLFRFVPRGLPANIITILSNFFIYASLYLAYHQEIFGKWNFVIIPFFILVYLIGDHLDGMQAKNTGTGSALGEFCDHYHDSFNNGIILMVICLLFGIDNSYLVAALIGVSYIAHAVVFYEQFKTGWLIFEKFGSLEAVVVTFVLLILGMIPDVFSIYQTELVLGFTVIEWIMISSTLAAIGTVVKTTKRLEEVKFTFWMYAVAMIVIAIIAANLYSPTVVFVILTLYSSVYIGKLMQGHLIDGIERSPGLFTPIILIVIDFTGFDLWSSMDKIIIGYLALNVIWVILKTTKPLRQCWVWWNPKQVES